MDVQQMKNIWKEGVSACFEKKRITENPYKENTNEHAFWIDGYESGVKKVKEAFEKDKIRFKDMPEVLEQYLEAEKDMRKIWEDENNKNS